MTPAQLASSMERIARDVGKPERLLRDVTLLVQRGSMERAPVKTGTLRRSLTSRVEGTRGYVGSNLEYAPHVHEGTRYMEARPFIQEAIDDSVANIERALSDWGDGLWRGVAGR